MPKIWCLKQSLNEQERKERNEERKEKNSWLGTYTSPLLVLKEQPIHEKRVSLWNYTWERDTWQETAQARESARGQFAPGGKALGRQARRDGRAGEGRVWTGEQ